jgi:addiction module HigA family antidote
MSTTAEHPGIILLERYLKPLGLTSSELAKSIGVQTRRVSDLVKARRAMTPDMAARLALFFDVPPYWWLDLQARYDATHRVHLDALRGVVTPYEGLADILVKPNGIEQLGPPPEHRAKVLSVSISDELVENLRAQVALAEQLNESKPRVVVTETYANGTVALVGR